MTSRIGRVAAASAQVGMLGATRGFRVHRLRGNNVTTECGFGWWSEGYALESLIGPRLDCPKLGLGEGISPGAEALTGGKSFGV